ncbi:MAG: hypothetical protein AAF585_07490 [Verrucomicrobiota bacterium]
MKVAGIILTVIGGLTLICGFFTLIGVLSGANSEPPPGSTEEEMIGYQIGYYGAGYGCPVIGVIMTLIGIILLVKSGKAQQSPYQQQGPYQGGPPHQQ